MKKKDVRLYNVLFPVWALMMFPSMWPVVILGNFLIDSLVLCICAKTMKLEEQNGFYKKHIFPVFCFGFLADILAAVPMWLSVWVWEDLGGPYGDRLTLTVPGVLIGAGLIYGFNYFISFRRCEKPLRRKLALTLALATAPYTFLIPSRWLYGGF